MLKGLVHQKMKFLSLLLLSHSKPITLSFIFGTQMMKSAKFLSFYWKLPLWRFKKSIKRS